MRAPGIFACTSGDNETNCTNKISSSGDGRPRTVYVGKYQYPVSLIKLTPVLDVAWKKKAGFNFLTSTVNYFFGSHNISDLITLVDGEVPVYTYYALHNFEKQMISVMKRVFDVKNLIELEFLRSTGKTVKLASYEVKDKTERIPFFTFTSISTQLVKIVVLFKTPFASSCLSGCLTSTMMTQQIWYMISAHLLRGHIVHSIKKQSWHLFLDLEE